MNNLAPVSVMLKFGFLIVIYLFLLWVSRSALRDLRGDGAGVSSANRASGYPAVPPSDATGLHSASTFGPADLRGRSPRMVVERAPGHEPGMIYDLDGDIVFGRGDTAEIRLNDPFASSRHARVFEQGHILVIEDLGSTNGTYLNEELLDGPRPLHPGDRVRIGDSEFAFEVD
ncbi:MAG TPA: FHA domain-containing protein [Solirubrobacteraceae bacterium]|nr:FHA domain-containing protein [Solirubrobacteraceae bacterium]